MTRLWWAGLVIAFLYLTLACESARAATRYDPRLRFRTISTARFDIHFHQGEEALAQRLARIVEDVATTLDRTLGPAAGRVQVILVDQSDLPNGWATPVPYNTIEMSAASPVAESLLGNVEDWMRLVFTHEYVHIVHLSRGAGWIGGLRRAFGRFPLLYPNLFQPIWQIEGIATWQESAQTGGGRVPAGDFRLFLERAATEQRLEPIDRASGRLVDWPAGNTPYLYGAYFHQYLADRYGADSLRRLTDETARQLPYFGPRAFRKVFGRSVGQLWEDFEASVPAREIATHAVRLTRHGFYVSGPRFGADDRLFYSLFDPHRFPALMELDLSTRQTRAITTRYLGNRIAVTENELVFDQIEIVRNVGQQSDLYAVDVSRGGARNVRRLTFDARAADPDISPDNSTLTFTVQSADRRFLATAPRSAVGGVPRHLASQPYVDFASPRWSPDGRSIAVEHRTRGGPSQIAVVDAATGSLRILVPTGRNAAPVWSPDGSTILFASASDDEPFQIFSVDVAGGAVRRLEGTGASAQSPAISPDGRSIVYVGYTADGYDLFQLQLTSARWTPVVSTALPPGALTAGLTPLLSSQPYSPARTIVPQFWTPTIESDGELVVGAATGSVDALGRHGYGVEAGWAMSRARPDWRIAYAYDRWRPTFFAVVSDDTDPWRTGLRRTIETDVGVILPSRRIRWSQTVLAELHTSAETFECQSPAASCVPAPGIEVRRRSIRTGLAFDTARMFGYSISAEEGGRVTTTLEYARSGSLDSASSPSAIIDVRRYLHTRPRHAAIAVRGAAAASWGDEEMRRVFSASGSDPQSGGFRFGSDAIGLIRGVDADRVLGTRAAVVNLDYRLPLARIERGVGTVPVFLRTIHAAVFLDAGTAWSDRFRSADLRYSAGAELSIDTILGYFAPATFTAGSVWRHGPDQDARGFAAFVRVGRAF